jgi:uncharacterized integral membrane protein
MHARQKAVSGGIVMILAFEVREVVLRFLGHRADTPLGILFLLMRMRMAEAHRETFLSCDC